VSGEWTLRPAGSTDRERVTALLERAGLPLAGVPRDLARFTVAESSTDGVIGAIGLEVYGRAALLRSAVVATSWQSAGIGRELVTAVLREAERLGVTEIFLLTTTADDYFPRFGFIRTERGEVPEPLLASEEFRGACPSSAVVMRRRL
jgi:amino-acid N-acetyltransferase